METLRVLAVALGEGVLGVETAEVVEEGSALFAELRGEGEAESDPVVVALGDVDGGADELLSDELGLEEGVVGGAGGGRRGGGLAVEVEPVIEVEIIEILIHGSCCLRWIIAGE